MALREPVAVYNAASNLEAAVVCEMLLAAGIETHVVEDVSPAGVWMLGLLPEIHKPQVWVDRADLDRVEPLLDEYERRAAPKSNLPGGGDSVEASCEECGWRATFPASRRGGIESCPHCGAYVDVGDVDFEDGAGDGAIR